MKKLNTTLLMSVILSILLFQGCKKYTYDDSLPVVKFISAVQYGFGDSVLLVGEVTSQGASPVQYVGFSFSPQPIFPILSRQALLNGTNGKFQYVVPAYPDSTYYFNCFAANSFGYAISGNYKYTVAWPALDTAPCIIANNTVIDNNVTYTMGKGLNAGANGGPGNDNIEVSNGNEILNFAFNINPVSPGIYITDGNPSDFPNSFNPNSVLITLGIIGFSGTYVKSGGSVYVGQSKNGNTISFCLLTYTVPGVGSFPIIAKITY